MQSNLRFYPLSQPQKSIWYLEKTYPDTSMNIVAGTLRLKSQVDYNLLEEAINLFIQKNEAMRLHIVEQDDVPMQYVAEYAYKKIDFIDFSKGKGLQDLYNWDEEQTKEAFPLMDADLYYFAMLKINDQDGGFYIKTHHFISDAWSMSIVGNQIIEYYTTLKAGKPVIDEPKPAYLTILSEEEKYLQSERFMKDKTYWDNKFAAYPEPTRLKPQTSSNISTKAKRKTLLTPIKLSNKIRQYCEENKVSVFTLFLAALAMYLNRAMEKEDIILGTTILNRSNQREKETMGMFASIGAPIRIGINGDLDFKTFVEEMTKECFSVLKHQRYPYNLILQEAKRKHNVANNLFDMVLTYQNSKFNKAQTNIEYITRWHFSGHQLESLIINISDREDEGCLIIDYDFLVDVFHIKEIEFIHQHVISLLWHALDNPLKKVAKLEMLAEKEKQRILYEFNHTKADFPQEKILPQFFEEQAAKTPDNVAVVFAQRKLTYRGLNEKVNQLARVLRNKGVGPDTVVGVCLYRSIEMVTGIFAILKAGGAYLPISPDYPTERIRYMLQDSGAKLLLTQGALIDDLQFDIELLDLEDERHYTGNKENLEPLSGPRNLAYVIYTSGSTGKPKGVMIEHRSIVNRIHWMQKKYPITAESTILQKTPFTFDVSVWELFWWSFVGAKVCMLAPEGEKDPAVIISAITEQHVTTMHFVPSMLSVFLDYVEKRGDIGKLATLKQVFVSGEALNLLQVNTFNRLLYSANGTELYNLYGPTEAAVDVSYFDCSPKVTLKTVPIGRPIDNIRLYILDKNRNLLPVGIPGELYIAGVGVGRGYINNPQLTDEKFVADPFYPGEVMYKTGDRVRWFPEGDIEYLGRIDFQVKIRGLRIELGEIESRLLAHEAIKDAVVVGRSHNNTMYLCAYLVAKKVMTTFEIKDHLLRDLPEYMVPPYFVFLDVLPLSPNGKVDRKALPEPDYANGVADEYVAPDSEIEKELAAIWGDVLEVEKVGVNESFFSLGGDSLRAIALITEIHHRLQIELSVRDIFRLQTVRHLSEHLQNAEKNNYLPIPRLADRDYYDVSSAQKRLFILKELEADDISYNLPGVMSVEGKMDLEKVEATFKALIARHESLRTSFILQNGQPVQRVAKNVDFTVNRLQATEDEIDSIVNGFIQPFDLSRAPLLRVGLVDLSDGRQLLLFDMHHIISDGTSINILIKEFANLYSAGEMPELKARYRDFAAWHNDQLHSPAMAAKEAYWLDRFSDEIPILNIPTDFPRPARKSFHGTRIFWQVPAELTIKLKEMARETGTTLYMVLLAAYTVLLSKYTAQEDITVGIPVEGRLHNDVRDVIGMFVNTLAIRNLPTGEKPFLEFLDEVKENLLKAYENQEYPFEELVEKAKVKRDLGRNPLFDTVFILQNVDIRQIQFDGVILKPYPFAGKSAKFDLTVEAYDYGDTLEFVAEYCTDLFTASTIRHLLEHFVNILQQLVSCPAQKISEIDMLTAAEKNQLLMEFNDTEAEFPRKKTLPQIFEEQAAITPDNIALVFKQEKLSYRQLNEKANQLAWLLREKGVGRDTIVAISVYRSLEMIIGILAILKAGGAYLPIDPDYPIDRITYILENSGTKLLLTQTSLMDKWQENVAVRIINIEDAGIVAQNITNLPMINDPRDLAYIIYTSGSTGKPKGVMIEHQNVVRLLFNSRFQFDFSDRDIWTMFHSFCFDFSVWEMYGALLYGGKLVIVPKEAAIDTREFLNILKQERVTVLNQTPAAFYNLIHEEMGAADHALTLRYVVFGGEALKPIMLMPFWQKYPQTRLINMYGITETTVHVTFKELKEEEIKKNISNVGRAIPTLKTYILDKNLHLLPIGVPGELCVSGYGVGRGYLNNTPLTKQKFIPNPFDKREILYRSGDLARVLPSGDIEYLGRIDSQVKIRGFRVELGEIESDLLKHPDINEVLVMAREAQSGDKKLYAYYVAKRELQPVELRTFLAQKLPDYMIPSYFIQLEKMPLNRNGKVDRSSLPKYDETANLEATYVEPQNKIETVLTEIWSDVLELTKVGTMDNFFELGGDSLGAIKVVAKITECCGQNITLVDLYNNPTVKQMVAKLTAGLVTDESTLLLNLTPKANREVTTNIICFPYGGGNALTYKDLSAALAKHSAAYRILAVNVPGHDIGGNDELLPVTEVAAKIVDEVHHKLSGDIILYGHCVGSALALETARLLEQENLPLKFIFLGAIFPPQFVRWYGNFFDPWMLYSDQGIFAYLNTIGLKESNLLNDHAKFIIKAFRHDVRSFYRYFYHLDKNGFARLNTPICSIVGENDPQTKNYNRKYKRWGRYSKEICLQVLKDADHYFMSSYATELAKMIAQYIGLNK